jgi:hypothetical protein
MAIGLTLTPNASVVAGESDSRPIIERVPLQTLVGDEVGSNLRYGAGGALNSSRIPR